MKVLRKLCCLSAARLAHDNHCLVVFHEVEQLGAVLIDGQRLALLLEGVVCEAIEHGRDTRLFSESKAQQAGCAWVSTRAPGRSGVTYLLAATRSTAADDDDDARDVAVVVAVVVVVADFSAARACVPGLKKLISNFPILSPRGGRRADREELRKWRRKE